LSHPNIVQVFDSGADGETQFIVMELVDGRTLSDRLQREGSVSSQEAASIGADVARALAAAHERGVIHRDVKPGNVMLRHDGFVKVVDFGIARASGTPTITRSGAILGSAPYLSPEQAKGAPGDERSDVYALGCVLYHMLAGRPPFVADDPMAALYQHVNEMPAPPSSIRPVPADLERIVLRCLEKDPSRRYASAGELAAALDASATGEPAATLPLIPANEPTARLPLAPTAAAPTEAAVGREASTSEPSAATLMRSPSRRRWIGAAVTALLLAGVIALVAARVEPNEPAASPQARATASAATSVSAEPPLDETPSVEEAYGGLLGAIAVAEAAGDIEDDVAAEAREDAGDVLLAYEEGDMEAMNIHVPDFGGDLASAADAEGVSAEAHSAIIAAFDDLVLAIENEAPELFADETSSPSQDDDDDDD
jgi:serine/threonine protein kinase